MVETEVVRIEELARRAFGDRTRVADLVALQGDASTRRYARAHLRGPGAVPSIIVMLLADRGVAMSSDELAVFATAPKELPYVNVHHFLARIGVAVPELYLDASEAGVLLLEDVGDTPLWDAVQGRSDADARAMFERAIDELVLLQIEGTRQRDDRCIAFQQSFDQRLYDWEFEHFIEWGLVKRSTRPIAPGELETLRGHFASIARWLDRQPRVLNHRDFHAWNLFVHQGRIRVIDFQDALLAAAPYDLATLLGDRDTPSVVRPDLERGLLAHYARAWAERGGPAWSEDELRAVYANCALQKAFKVVGRFHYLDLEKGKTAYLRYIPPTLRRIAHLLSERPDLAEVGAILARHFPELAP